MQNWQRTKIEYLRDKYSHMKERVTNPLKVIQGRNYLGLSICTREDFVAFGLSDPTFNWLFKAYKRSKGKRIKAPSIDRKNPRKGYTLDNIQFLTLSENSLKDRKIKWFELKNVETGKIFKFFSTSDASKFLGQQSRIKGNRAHYFSFLEGIWYENWTTIGILKEHKIYARS